jgi:hypothetical protein
VCVNSASTVLRGAGANLCIGLISATSSERTGGNGNANLVDIWEETGLLDILTDLFVNIQSLTPNTFYGRSVIIIKEAHIRFSAVYEPLFILYLSTQII